MPYVNVRECICCSSISDVNTPTCFTLFFAGIRRRRLMTDNEGRRILDQKYDVSLLDYFHCWVSANTVCLPNSRFPGQVVSTVAKFLFFSLRGAPFRKSDWKVILDVAAVEEWIERHSAQHSSQSTQYNYMCCIEKAAQFCYAKLGLQPKASYHKYMDAKMRMLRRRRRIQENCRLASEGERGPKDLGPLCRTVLRSSQSDVRMSQAVKAARAYLAGDAVSYDQNDFLFALRYSLMHVMVASAARPSAVYMLKMEAIDHPVGQWDDDSPVLLRNPYHKTGANVGPCRLVVSGHSKKILYLYYSIVRRAAILGWGLDTDMVFFNTKGKDLSASMVSSHIKALQRYCGIGEPLSATDIRKAVTSQLRGGTTNDDDNARTIASALCHSVATNDKYYTLGRRDKQALDFHKKVDRLLGECL